MHEHTASRSGPRLHRWTLVALLTAASLLPAIPAHAAPMTVGAGVVAAGNDGTCSLREAIANANADAQTWADCPPGSGADVITLPKATYHVDDTIRVGDSAFQITSDVSLIGAGRARLDAGSSRRHFHVHPGASLHLDDLQLRDGSTAGAGGAILNEGSVGTNDVSFVSNDAHSGGAVANWCPSACTVGLTTTDSFFGGNTATLGGGIYNDGELTLVDSTLRDNEAEHGSAIYNTLGEATIDRSVVNLNSGIGDGSEAVAVFNGGTLSVSASTIRDNTGSGIANVRGSATIVKSTISGNAGTRGGGVWNLSTYTCFSGHDWFSGSNCVHEPASLTIRDSTISQNDAFGVDSGGGIWSSDWTSVEDGQTAQGTLSLTNVTIVGNTSPAGAQVRASGAHVRNTVIGQRFGVASCDQTDDDVSWTGHHNLSDDGSCASGGFTDTGPLLLYPLADNGGPTLTRMPHPASPVVNAGHQTTCDEGSKPGSATDQRGTGFPRTVGSSCDVGAVEAGILKLLIVLKLDLEEMRFRSGPAAGNEGLRRSLGAKLDAAMDAVDRDDHEAASGQLGAFRNQVAAHEGKRIAEADAGRLMMGAEAIVGLLPSEHPPEPV